MRKASLPTPRVASLLSSVLERRSGSAFAGLMVALLGATSMAAGFGIASARWADGVDAPELIQPARSSIQEAGEGIIVYGPQRFESVRRSTAVHIESFDIEPRADVRYRLVIENGGSNRRTRVSRTSLELNGAQLLRRDRLRGDPSVFEDLDLLDQNSLRLDLRGRTGAFVTVTIYQLVDNEQTIFGPVELVSIRGRRNNATHVFDLPANAIAPFTLHFNNGNPDGSDRATSASIRLNGERILRARSSGKSRQSAKSRGSEKSRGSGRSRGSEKSRGSGKSGGFGGDALEVPITPQTTGNVLELSIDGAGRSRRGARTTRIEVFITAHIVDITAPTVTITSPTADLITSAANVIVTGTIEDESATTVEVNGVVATVVDGSTFSAEVPLLVEGDNLLTVVAVDAFRNTTGVTRTIIRDTQPPMLAVDAPSDGFVTGETSIGVSGTVTDLTPVMVNANGVMLPVDAAGVFGGSVALNEGVNFITVTATDAAGNSAPVVRIVTSDTQPPTLAVTEPADGTSTAEATITVGGTVDDDTEVVLTVGGMIVAIGTDGSFSTDVELIEGANPIHIVATDAAMNSTEVTHTVTRINDSGLPPDPSIVAPEVDMAVATTLAAGTAFLYTGENPIQIDVAPGTIDPMRIAVLRGRVSTRAGAALPGVEITALDHPELGSTLSRADGAYDLAVNGGGRLTLTYAKENFLSAQRTVDAPWQDYRMVEDLVLVELDPQVTMIDLTTPTTEVQVAQGTMQSDADGARQGTVLFRPGTTAEMVLPDGTVQALSSLHVRATEYTVGENGPQSMPAPLPPTSAYTYAVELSVDEALAAGAETVRFSQPVPFYVENFLGFPVGLPVPLAFLDEDRGTWVPADDGRIIGIVSETAGLADVDVDGDGVADDAAAAALGITDGERERLAELYEPGASLWRVALSHFSAIDLNYPELIGDVDEETGEFEEAEPPKENPKTDDEEKVDDTCEITGMSIIECQNQVLGERIAITGTPFTLNYRSDRVPGRRAAYSLEIPLVGASVPANLIRVELEIFVAGRSFTETFPPDADQSTSFTWDGLDAYGRELQGGQPIRVRISYVYPSFYAVPPGVARSFGLSCDGTSPQRPGFLRCIIDAETNSSARQEGRKSLVWEAQIGAFQVVGAGLGGWSLDVHHAYDLVQRVLYRGDGGRRSATEIGRVITTVVGNGEFGFSGDGGPATEAVINFPGQVDVGPDGSLYIAELFNSRIRKVSPDGTISTVAGNGEICFNGFDPCGDGGPATEASLSLPFAVAVGPDGSLYNADFILNRVRRVSPEGIITTVAGTGAPGFSGDGGPATSAMLNQPFGVAFGPDGSMYIADDANHRIRKVSPDGIIQTVVGTGEKAFSGDGGPARQAAIDGLAGIAVAPDGSLYFGDRVNDRIRRVSPEGIITTVARLQPTDVVVAPDGSIYVAESNVGKISRLSPDGVITTVAGTGENGFSGDGGPPRAAVLNSPLSMALAPDGSIYVSDTQNHRIRHIEAPLPGLSEQVVIASEDGSEVYILDVDGRHQRTVDALTGVTRFEFAYDAAGLLTTLTDVDGNVTTIERDVDGTPLAIVAPFGQRTALALRPDGFLASVANPANESIGLTYHAGGLLATFTDPRGNTSQFTYDEDGRLIRDDDAVGGFVEMARTEFDGGFEVSKTTANGLTTTYRIEALPGGGQRRVNTGPAGQSSVSRRGLDGQTRTTSPDGAETAVTEGPDPRFGMQGPVLQEATVTTPEGLTLTVLEAHEVVLADPRDPLSLQRRTDRLTVNGRMSEGTYTALDAAFLATTPEGRQSLRRFDARGRVIEESTRGFTPIEFTYDGFGRLEAVALGSRTWQHMYDASGRLASATDPLQRSTQFTYDAADRLTRQVFPGTREVRYGYDAAGNLTSVTPSGRTAHSFAYSPVNLVTEYRPPAVDDTDPSTRYTYDLDRALTQMTRPDGISIDFVYDDAGRMSQVTFPGGLVEYGYDQVTGNPTSINGPYGSALNVTYDASLLTSMQWIGEVEGTVGAGYNSDFRVQELRVNGADPVMFTYDDDGLVMQAGALSATRDQVSGRLTGTTVGGLATTQGYNTFGELSSLGSAHGSTALYASSYTRDALGRIEAKMETLGGVTTTFAYKYDPSGKLTQVDRDGVSVEVYTYDDNGNRTSFTSPSGVVVATYDAQDRLLTYGANSYTYTANGELTAKIQDVGTTSYSYDVLGNLLGVELPSGTRIDYIVDALGRRVGRKVDGVLEQGWLYQDGLNPIAELDAAGAALSRFVYGTRSNVPDYIVRGGVTYRIVSDELGSVRLVVDVTTGAVVQELNYDAWGRVLMDTNPGWQPFGYAGGLYDPLTELVRFGARDYDAEVGRWTAKDPISFAGGSGSVFAFLGGDPINLVDPTGLGGGTECALAIASLLFSVGGDLFVAAKLLKGLPIMARFLARSLQFGSRGGLLLNGPEILRIDGYAFLVPGSKNALDAATTELGRIGSDLAADALIPGALEAASAATGAGASRALPSLKDVALALIPGVGSWMSLKTAREACATPETNFCPVPPRGPSIQSSR